MSSSEEEMEEKLPSSLLQAVLARTEALDCARAACVNRRWRSLASEDSLWMHHCNQAFGVSAPADIDWQPCSSFKDTYASWFTQFRSYGALTRRTKLLWDDLRQFLRASFPEVADTLSKQASEADILRAEEYLGFELPPHARLLYRFCNGQDVPDGDENTTQFVGLLGGYYFYNHFVNVQLLPLQQVVIYTKRLDSRFPRGSKWIVVAASCNLNKFFMLNCEDGMMLVGSKNFINFGHTIPCMQQGNPDGMLRWLELYRDSLLSGKYKVKSFEEIRSITLFPETEPLCTEAITSGVQVRCSSVLVPELSDDEYVYAYSVRMRLLPVSGLSFNQCQLSRRHWIISQEDVVVDELRGEAVVGMYPVLQLGGDVFVYESCSNQRCRSGSMEGDFTFVPGVLTRPEGPEFRVRIAPFPLVFPEVIF